MVRVLQRNRSNKMYLCRRVRFIVRNLLVIVGSASLKSIGQAVRLEAEGRINVAVLSLNTAWRQSVFFLRGPQAFR